MNDNSVINNVTNASEPRKYVFDHSRLDVYRVLLEALVLGEKLARAVPRGYSTLVDQLRRAQQSALLQFVEGVARTGADRVSRLKVARAEACEAAACIEALKAVGVAKADQAERVLELLWRACAMLTQLQRVGR